MNYYKVFWNLDYDTQLHETLENSSPIAGDIYMNNFLNEHNKALIPGHMVDWVQEQIPPGSNLEAIPIAFEIVTGIPKEYLVMFNVAPLPNLNNFVQLDFTEDES